MVKIVLTDESNTRTRYQRRRDETRDRLVSAIGFVERHVTSLEPKIAPLHGEFAVQSERMHWIDVRLRVRQGM